MVRVERHGDAQLQTNMVCLLTARRRLWLMMYAPDTVGTLSLLSWGCDCDRILQDYELEVVMAPVHAAYSFHGEDIKGQWVSGMK